MLPVPDQDLSPQARRLRVATLVRLRWLAVAGQLAAVLLVRFGLGFPLPVWPCLLTIATSAAMNLWLEAAYGAPHLLEDRPAAAQFAFDILQLSVLLLLTGGLQNPFAMLFLAPVMISATSLRP